ncbi:MAG TPA: oligosaccharide flippase family protein [Burkholderiales bacterium]|nr:oligosaccharide flippase family protein [Burkholderiales bacterium]
MAQPPGLALRSIHAALWGASGSALQIALQFGIQVVLARLLGPEQYGLFAMAAAVISLGGFFSYGLATGLVQKRTLTDADVRFANFWQLVVGATVAAAVFALAGPAAVFFHEPRVAPLIQTLAVLCLVQALSAVSGGLLNRELDFKSVQLAALAAYALGYGLVGVPLALAGYGVDALVMAFLIQTLAVAAIQYARKRQTLGLLVRHPEAGWFLRYAATVSATQINNWALMQLPRVVVGRLFPSAAVGLYSLPYNLMTQLAGTVTGLQGPLFSAGARVQGNAARLRSVFLTMLAATTLLAAPPFIGMAAAAHTLVLAVYGEAWVESAPLLCAFALAMPFYIATTMGTPMLWNSGRTTQELTFQLPIVFVLAAAAWAAAQYSLAAVAWVMCGIFALRFVVITAAACKALQLRVRDVGKALQAGIAVSVLVAVAIMFVDPLFDNPQLALALDITAGLAVQLAALALLRPWFPAEVQALFAKLRTLVPGRA